VTPRTTLRFGRTLGAAAALLGALVVAEPARADVTLVEKDGWTVFMNGRMQAFFNYNRGNNRPKFVLDGNGKEINLQSGFDYETVEFSEVPEITADNDAGVIEELRLRTGFTGNVLGFGIKRKINDTTDVTGYTAVTVYIEHQTRRKYTEVSPDWRQSYLKVSAPWGAVTAGRDGCLYNRGGTEITFLYGFKYGLGWPGSINGIGPTAGHVGFGVLANAFCSGFTYSTPSLAGAQLNVGVYDPVVIPGATYWERTKWPRAETELTFEREIGTQGMFKVFVNGMYQKIYQREGENDGTLAGVGGGARVEFGPFHAGITGHYGDGVGVGFALHPASSFFHPAHPGRKFRTMDGAYAQLMLSPLKTIDVMAGAGLTEVQLLPEDKIDYVDDDGAADTNGDGINDTTGLPLRPSRDDDAIIGVDDSAGHVPIHRQIGFSGGVAYHFTDNLHLQLEYFRGIITWYKPSPSADDAQEPAQAFHVVNAGVTYDF
jgi:hypothetical protein